MSNTAEKDRPPYLTGLLDDRKIQSILVIDDVFDAPSLASLPPGSSDDLWAELEASPEALEEICELIALVEGPDDINDEFLAKLLNARSKLVKSEAICSRLIDEPMKERENEIRPFLDCLREELQRQVICLGSNSELTEIGSKIVFLDYILGPKSGGPADVVLDPDQHDGRRDRAIAAARSTARRIYSRYEEEGLDRPLIVLMSSVPDVAIHQEEFRDQSELLGGMFHFIPKAELNDRHTLLLRLSALAMALPVGYEIQHFVEAVRAAMQEASVEFLKQIRRLTISDYVQIQKLALQEDGTPLGDYMLWLYGSYLSHLLFEADASVRGKRRIMDQISFEKLVPSELTPSDQLVRIYHCAVSAMVEDVGPHAHTPGSAAGSSTSLQLGLGDIFMERNNASVWMVLNCDCDLVDSPLAGRTIDSGEAVHLLPGRLVRLGEASAATAKLRTELFYWQDSSYRILWDVKRARSVPYGEMRAWVVGNGLRRVARLRTPFALELQRAFAADLTRVGLPVPPPIFENVSVEVWAPGANGQGQLVLESKDGAFLAHMRKSQRCILTVGLGCELKRAVERAIQVVEGFRSSLSEGDPGFQKQNAASARWIKSLGAFHQEFDRWFIELGAFEPPKSGQSRAVGNHPLVLERGVVIGEEYEWRQPLVLNILDAS